MPVKTKTRIYGNIGMARDGTIAVPKLVLDWFVAFSTGIIV